MSEPGSLPDSTSPEGSAPPGLMADQTMSPSQHVSAAATMLSQSQRDRPKIRSSRVGAELSAVRPRRIPATRLPEGQGP